MALFGLFGGKKDEPKKGDFFLDFEEAQTLGDTEYMKESKTIKRTFPKLKGNPGAVIVSRVSSDDMSTVGDNAPAAPAASAPAPTSSFAQSTSFAGAASSFTPASTTPAAPAPVAETPAPAAPAPVAETPAAPVVEEAKAPEPAPTFTPAPVPEKKTDTSMDMFRNMAKNIRR